MFVVYRWTARWQMLTLLTLGTVPKVTRYADARKVVDNMAAWYSARWCAAWRICNTILVQSVYFGSVRSTHWNHFEVLDQRSTKLLAVGYSQHDKLLYFLTYFDDSPDRFCWSNRPCGGQWWAKYLKRKGWGGPADTKTIYDTHWWLPESWRCAIVNVAGFVEASSVELLSIRRLSKNPYECAVLEKALFLDLPPVCITNESAEYRFEKTPVWTTMGPMGAS